MKKLGLILASFCLLLVNWLMAGDPLRDHPLSTSIGNDPRKAKAKPQTITRQQLVHQVDSLLDLDSISVHEVELIRYYNRLLTDANSTCAKVDHVTIPATDYYEDFDESHAFQVCPLPELPECQSMVLQNDSLGFYQHPRNGPTNSGYGWRHRQLHKGIDIGLVTGDTVVCAFNGMVRIAKRLGGYGNVIIVRHYNGLETVYAHLSKIVVNPGEMVSAGQVIGLGGSTGHSTGPHLHFELRFKGYAINPAAIISMEDQSLRHDTILLRRSATGLVAFPSNAMFHTITKGDNWYKVAATYGLSLPALCALNNTRQRYALKIGDQLRIQ